MILLKYHSFFSGKKKKALKDITKEMLGNGMLGNRARLDHSTGREQWRVHLVVSMQGLLSFLFLSVNHLFKN